jgi:hypothetical protein
MTLSYDQAEKRTVTHCCVTARFLFSAIGSPRFDHEASGELSEIFFFYVCRNRQHWRRYQYRLLETVSGRKSWSPQD